jgi:hypothetical protein
MKIKFIIVTAFALSCTFSCRKPDRKEFAGRWESGDKAMIVLHEDHTCFIRNMDASKIWSHRNDSINGTGKWEFIPPDKFSAHYCIYVDLNKIHFPLYVTGAGMTGYFIPWKLFMYIGDPDDMNLLEFYKSGLN